MCLPIKTETIFRESTVTVCAGFTECAFNASIITLLQIVMQNAV